MKRIEFYRDFLFEVNGSGGFVEVKVVGVRTRSDIPPIRYVGVLTCVDVGGGDAHDKFVEFQITRNRFIISRFVKLSTTKQNNFECLVNSQKYRRYLCSLKRIIQSYHGGIIVNIFNGHVESTNGLERRSASVCGFDCDVSDFLSCRLVSIERLAKLIN